MPFEKIFAVGMDIVAGVVGFGLCVMWGKTTGRDMDRDTLLFLGKIWGALATLSIIMLLIF